MVFTATAPQFIGVKVPLLVFKPLLFYLISYASHGAQISICSAIRFIACFHIQCLAYTEKKNRLCHHVDNLLIAVLNGHTGRRGEKPAVIEHEGRRDNLLNMRKLHPFSNGVT